MFGGTYNEGDFDCEPEDLADNLPILIKDMVDAVPDDSLPEQTIKLVVTPQG